MSTVSGVTSGNASSIYGSRNVLSGMASGLDTESMIENAVSGIQTKISSLQQQQTTLEWKQEAYRSTIDKMVQFSRKYTSYTSSTNLLSSSFFTKAVTTTTQGANASMVSATGKSTSEVEIHAVKSLATAARAVVSGANLGASDDVHISADEVDLGTEKQVSTISGSLTLNYGSKSVSIDFGELEVYDSADELAAAIREKLGDEQITLSSGDSVAADTLLDVTVDGSTIQLGDKSGAGNSVYVSSATGDIKDTLGLSGAGEEEVSQLEIADPAQLKKTVQTAEYLSGKTLSITLDGVTKKLSLPLVSSFDDGLYFVDENGDKLQDSEGNAMSLDGETFTGLLQDAVDQSFGTGKITVSGGTEGSTSLALSFEGPDHSTMAISSDVNEFLGMASTETSYLNTSRTLEELGLGESFSQGDQALVINDVTIGTYSKDTALETILKDINANAEAGVNVSFSTLTNRFVFETKETGAGQNMEMGAGLAQDMFGAPAVTAGTDAVVVVGVNGEAPFEITRSTNTFDVDGLSVTVKGEFDSASDGSDPVTFTTKADSDKIVDAVKSMIDDYNAMVKEIRDAYATLPVQKSNGSKYEPLTEDDMADMSDTAIENYEEKAKTGILFGDSDLSSLYSKLLSAITPSGSDGTALRNMGLVTSYDSGLTTLSLDEDKLRETLENNPDAVKDVFTKSKDSGSSTDGLMTKLKTQLDAYASVSGTKGILVNKAGTSYSSLSLLNNTLQSQMDDNDNDIVKWQDKLSDKIDYYTQKFTRLEQLISEMNSQSSALAGMMGTG